MTVHNHGTEEGDGLSCPESRQDDGSLKGECVKLEELQSSLFMTSLNEFVEGEN